MRTLVTGAAGFIGSSLVDQLLTEGHDVVGIDCYTSYYDREAKERNLALARRKPEFRFLEADLRTVDLAPVFDGIEVLLHCAAQPGVRRSWSREFAQYAQQNILVTHRLLDAARSTGISRIVYASSSSVYGNAPTYPTDESELPRPHSPYGVTKLAGEHLCNLYAMNYGMSTVSLRYFTVYGPRQRPDMAIHRLIESGLRGGTFELYGSGEQVRDFTFVGDVVQATLAAMRADVGPGTVCNVAGGGSVSMNGLVTLVQDLTKEGCDLVRRPAQAGDVDRTGGAVDLAHDLLAWTPEIDLRTGLQLQIDWHRSLQEVPPFGEPASRGN